MHRLLSRQIKKFFGEDFVANHSMSAFLEAVDSYYNELEKECKLIENALEISTTELKSANEKVKKANTDLTNAILNTLNDCVAAIDENGNILFTNPSAGHLTGYTQEEMLGRNFHELLHYHKLDGTHFPIDECEISKAIISDPTAIISGESHIIKKDGSIAFTKYTGTPIFRDDKRFGHVLSLQDLTEQRKKEALLVLQNNALNAAANMILITDDNGFIEYANNAFFTFTKFETDTIIGRHTRVLGGGLNEKNFYANMWKTIKRGHTWEGVLFNRKADGTVYPEEMTITPIMEQDKITHFIAVKKDITERIANEEALKDSAQRALEASKMKSEFLSTMSHEIRTPMNGIIGMTEILLQTEMNKEQNEFAKIIKHSAESLLTILNDILDFSKMEAGKLDIVNSVFDLPETCSGVSKLLGSGAKQKGLDFNIQIDRSIPVNVEGDPVRIRQIMMNLIGNAIKFTEKGFVKVRVTPISAIEDGFIVRFSVEDSGIGISNDASKKLFTSFMQADSSTSRKFGGTGLGLAICKKLVSLMNGDIGVVSKEGIGSTFWFEIPLKTSNINIQEKEEKRHHEIFDNHFNNINILLAEDNVVNQKIAMIQLEKLGLLVDIAANGQEAIDKALTKPYNLILMDCQMPTKDGYSATRELRSCGFNKPILAMTANAMQGDREKCIASGMDDYLTKPIDIYELRQMLDKWLFNDNENKNMGAEKYISRNRLEEFFGDDLEITREFLDIYLESTHNILEEIGISLESNNIEKINQLGHNLKGSSANAGVKLLSDIGNSIEKIGKDQDILSIKSQLENAKLILQAVEKEINEDFKSV
jgi:PAS domain S-box-containing protein